MKILITGATGLIGKQVGKKLVQLGHDVVVVSRQKQKALLELPFPCTVLENDFTKDISQDPVLQTVEAVVHLAGENVGESRWSQSRKERILKSRSAYTENLLKSFPANSALKTFVSASGVGFYGDRTDEELTEESSMGDDFLAQVCQAWEAPVLNAQKENSQIRFVILRTAMVLDHFGGALQKMLPAFRLGAGGSLGNGEQWVSWIHIQDLVNLYVEALTKSSMKGVYNASSPEPCRQKDFAKHLAKSMNVRRGPPAPKLVLKAVLGEMSSLVLASQRVITKRLKLVGFRFEFPDIQSALQDACKYIRNGDCVFYSEQFIPKEKSEVFSFFAEAENLGKITPSTLHFEIKNKSTPLVQEGTLIDYRLKIHGVPVHWRTEIEYWSPYEKFVDIQLKGPYKKWQHTHSFSDLPGGTLMTDLVRYRLPLGTLGQIVAGGWVTKDVQKIFSYRRSILGNTELLKK